ncbi:ABC transporter ATP-binding protein [Thermosipho ferrireducens]|uniref:ABC transporter ATP-binding protein n=1 Tax=Thermosipho ferrireducens TaxID=2571116 RepID=A0ABX7S8S8_9BACT|nr:ABC transporter ATP-binding protein [Thermosipho ferrireducens]QTA38241.1 ABC transporter ATP-binding protein [Thermosipho ferrireducens]
MKALEVYKVSKYFNKGKKRKELIRAVDSISFEVYEKEIFGILGPNGSGKSTLIRMISTLLIPDEGTIKVFGYDVIKDAFKIRNIINRVSVEASFFKKLSAKENLLFAAGLYGLSRKRAFKKVLELSQKVNLPHNRLNEPLEDFSRGMQQKVAIARAFLTSPKLLLLDEPTTGLDPRAKKEVQELIVNARKEGTTILLTTHDMLEAEKLCDRVAIIHKGKIIVIGTPEELKRSVNPHSKNVTLEDVFMFYTGETFEEEFQEVS